MISVYRKETEHFETILDYIRFGITEAAKHEVYLGHGTDTLSDELFSLVLGSLFLPYDSDSSLLNTRLTKDEKNTILDRLYSRIHKKIPVAYLIKNAFFCGLSFYVDERVLIPRSPIAELIQKQFQPWVEPDSVDQILDLCTGSGCIAIACNYAFPNASVTAVDISSDALAVAEINREEHRIPEDELLLVLSDCFRDVPAIKYDIIVSNPPYVGDDEMESLPTEYSHEPDIALRTTNNGLAIVEDILENAKNFLNDNGILVVEVGNSCQLLAETYPEIPFTWLEFDNGGDGVFLLTAEQLQALNFKKG